MNRLVVSTIFVLPQNMRNPLDQYFVVGKLATTSFATRSPFGAKGLNRRNTEDPLCRVQNSPLSYSKALLLRHDIMTYCRKVCPVNCKIRQVKLWIWLFLIPAPDQKNHLTFIDFYSLRRSNPLKPMDLTKHGWRPIFPASVSTEILAMTQIRNTCVCSSGLTP